MKYILITTLAALAVGCGKADFNGTFKGKETGTQNGSPLSLDATVTFTEDGDKVSGVWTNSSNASGTITGTKDGNDLKSVSMTWTGCTGTSVGTGKLDGDKFTGSGAGTFSCNGTSVAIDASFDLTRQ